MSIAITLTDKQGNEINYDANSMLSEVTHYGYINITYNLASMLQALPCKWPRKNWENKELYTLIPQIQESITALYRNQTKYIRYNSPNGFGTTNTAFHFLSAMLILCTCYPHAICHVE